MNLKIPQNENDIVAVRSILDRAKMAAELGHVVTATFGYTGIDIEVSETAIPLRQCSKRPFYKVRDSRAEMCFCGGDDDGHPLVPAT